MTMIGAFELNQIYTGDARELAKGIPDESIDLIFTDPPYPREFLPLYGWLAETAARVLKPGGSLLALSGLYHLDKVWKFFSDSLNYYWMNCYYLPTVTNTTANWPRRIFSRWKPILWFIKGERLTNRFVQDGVSGAFNDKRFHHWGQDEQWAFYWIDQISEMNDIIFDPFVGGGTVSAVCKVLGRQYIAFEIDPDTADLARERVRNTQPPLFVLQPEQTEMELSA